MTARKSYAPYNMVKDRRPSHPHYNGPTNKIQDHKPGLHGVEPSKKPWSTTPYFGQTCNLQDGKNPNKSNLTGTTIRDLTDFSKEPTIINGTTTSRRGVGVAEDMLLNIFIEGYLTLSLHTQLPPPPLIAVPIS